MVSSSLFVARLCRLARISSLAVLVFSAASVSRAQLLYERHQGGPIQYNGYDENVTVLATIDFDVPVRITGISGWMRGGEGDIATVGISADFLENGFFTTFPVESTGSLPGKWQGVSSLKWDLQPGSYQVSFRGAFMPFSLGYNGPLSSAPEPRDWAFRSGGVTQEAFLTFGVRIFGTPLSAVPEPSTYGEGGGLVLLAAAFIRLRKRAGG